MHSPAQASPRICGERVSLGMGEIKQPRRGRAGDAVPPSATTVKTYIQPVVQEAKNTRHATDLICNRFMSTRDYCWLRTGHCILCPRRTKRVHAQRNVLSRAYYGVSPGETRRSYLLQGSLMLDVSPRFTTSMGIWIWLLRHSACA